MIPFESQGKKQFAYRCEYTHRVYIFKLIENGLKI